MMKNVIGKRLKMAREANNFTQVQVKHYTNINNKTLSGYEKGVSEPDIDTLKALAKLYETSVEYLIGDTDDPSPRKDVRDVFTPEVLREHGIEYAEVTEYLKKNDITDKEAIEMLKGADEFRKRMLAKFVEKN